MTPVDKHAEVIHVVDFAARGMATEAIQTIRSKEKLDDLRYITMEHSVEEIKRSIDSVKDKLSENTDALHKKIEAGFKSYDSKFWALAVMAITLLAGGLITIIVKFPTGH